jgi:outer membrane protein OmpA-like peptidoglycan-associated protein
MDTEHMSTVTGGCPPYTYLWDFGDGTTSTEQNPRHTYQTEGKYTSSVTVTDAKGNQAVGSFAVTATCPPVSATPSGNPTTGTAPFAVAFRAGASGGCPPLTYAWDFGDGATSAEENPTHEYTTDGTYSATLAVTDSKGSTSQAASVSVAASAALIPTPEKPVILEGVNFETNKAVLLEGSGQILNRVAESLIAHPEVKVEVGGHSDADGSEAYNLKLSQRRANAVRDYLVKMGVPPAQLTAKGYGESQPIAPNTTPEGKAENRRVELKRM